MVKKKLDDEKRKKDLEGAVKDFIKNTNEMEVRDILDHVFVTPNELNLQIFCFSEMHI